MTNLVVPKLLDLPEKLVPLITEFNSYRYFLTEGGRGGAKSQSIARLLIYLAEQHSLRIVCGREIQKSINESVYSLFVDLIKAHNLAFEVLSTRITHKVTGTTIHFRGFREQGSFNIQGMEGVDIVWIDEAQALTKQTLDVLIPTIRKDKAKVFFSMNRHVVDDPAFDMFFGRSDCLHIHVDYFDNPFCTDALKREAEECKKKSEKDYNHIWLGQPLAQSEDSVFGWEELKDTQINKYQKREHYGMRLAGFDIARYGDDMCACVIIQQMGALHWETIFFDEWDHKDLNFTTGRILEIFNDEKVDKAIVDEDGIGSGPLDSLRHGRGMEQFLGFRNPPISYQKDRFYANNRTKNAYKLKEMVTKGHIAITDDKAIKELTTLKYTFDHSQRKILISKEAMRNKFQMPSPDMADALIMAVSMIGDVKIIQDVQYTRQNEVAPEEDLFGIAGIR